jgi:hypothetical protein
MERAMTGTNGSIYRWRVGEVEITRVLEFEAPLFEPAVIHPGASSEIISQHRAWLEPTLMDPGQRSYDLRVSQHSHKDAAADHPG